MNERTCIHYNGTYHNTHCRAGVCYHDVTTEPDRLYGSAWRIPCIQRTESELREASSGQIEKYSKRGSCDKFLLPTAEQLAEDEAEFEARWKEISESLEKGIVPEGVFVCGPGTIGSCVCKCPESCGHKWNGPVVRDGGMETATCSICGKWAINHDMWLEE